MLKLLRIMFYLILLLFLVDIFAIFQTKIGILKAVIYYGMLLVPVPLFVMECRRDLKWLEAFIKLGVPTIVIAVLLYLNPIKLVFHIQPWKTQTVLLMNKNLMNHKVEFQLKDIGALGYAKRKAEVVYLSKYFYIVLSEKYDDRNGMGHPWKRVGQEIN